MSFLYNYYFFHNIKSISFQVFDIEGAGPSESARKVRERSSVLLWLLVITSVLFFPPLGLASLYLMVTVSFLRDSYVWYICIICAENLIQF